ncbi:MAG: PBP1A family penicillin-binding protein [Oscillospiraceae bacterium]|nr:PBP1A family penicillin-binding protein [Oscillospiraceae bacterium]
MNVKAKRIVKKTAKTGAWAISDIVFLIIKTMGTLFLIAITTGILFSCIFLMYVKANLTTGLEVDPADFSMSLSSVIYYTDPATNRPKELVTLQSTEFRRWVNYDEIPEHMINALVAIEDHRFYNHHGVDWYRTAGAFMNMFLSMRDTFGGSTITQQLIKNLTNEDDVTIQRKLQEIFRAIEYERQYSKEEILELYLNLVYFGHGCYGIGAAANYYFGKDASQLTLAESAAIIGITNNPSLYSPYADREANKERQEDIIYRMYELGYIVSEQEYNRSINERLNFKRGDDTAVEQVVYTWFEEAVIRDVIQDMIDKMGYSETYAKMWLYNRGLKIYATIDPNIQDIVDNVYTDVDSLPAITGSSQQVQSGIIIADPYTGEVKALSGGVGNKTRNMLLNRATMTRRPPGSSLKPISAYAPAMDKGILTSGTLYEDSEYVTLSGTTWMPKNSDRGYSGIVDVRTAIRMSLNTIPAVVIDQLTPSVSYRFLRDVLGFNLHPADEDYAPLAAGQLTNGATVREMASAFTMFPNNGERVELHTYSVVYDADNNVFLDNGTVSNRAISEETAYWMTDLLRDAATNGTGYEANLGFMPTAGKTGTSTDSEDRWFVGFTPYYVCAVWTGYDMPATMRVNGNPAAQIWKRIMSPIHEGLESKPFYEQGSYYIPPVQGVSRIEYTVRCADAEGEVLREDTGYDIANRKVTKQAPEIEGYVLVSEPSMTISLSVDPSRNVILFVYEPEEPEEPEDIDDVEGVDGEDGEDGAPGDNEYNEGTGGEDGTDGIDIDDQFFTDGPGSQIDTGNQTTTGDNDNAGGDGGTETGAPPDEAPSPDVPDG